MENKLRAYVESLFEETSPTKKAIELREEMIQNLEDKYNDLISEGKSPEAAFNIAVAGIGDVRMLFEHLENDFSSEPEQEKYEQARRKSAMLTTVAVMIYILCLLPVPLLNLFNVRNAAAIGAPIILVMIAIATGMLIYNSMTKPSEMRKSDGLVEEFLEWKHETHETRQLRTAISTALWAFIIATYFIVSFTFGRWHITWVIFVLGAGIEALINMFFVTKMRNKGK